MPDDSVLSWALLTVITYGSVIYFIAKGLVEKGKYKRDSDRFYGGLNEQNNYQRADYI